MTTSIPLHECLNIIIRDSDSVKIKTLFRSAQERGTITVCHKNSFAHIIKVNLIRLIVQKFVPTACGGQPTVKLVLCDVFQPKLGQGHRQINLFKKL